MRIFDQSVDEQYLIFSVTPKQQIADNLQMFIFNFTGKRVSLFVKIFDAKTKIIIG